MVPILRLFLEQSGVGVAHLDRALRIGEVNADFCRQLGCGPAELADRAFRDLVHPAVRDRLEWRLSGLINGCRPPFADQVAALCPEGRELLCAVAGFAVHGEAGRVDSVVVLVRPKEDVDVPGRVKLLSHMDARVLEGVAAGASNVQLAAVLHLSRGGVEYHVAGLLRKLEVRNRSPSCRRPTRWAFSASARGRPGSSQSA